MSESEPYIIKHKTNHRTHTVFWVCVLSSISLVSVGWLLTMKGIIADAALEAKDSVDVITKTTVEIFDQTKDSAQGLVEVTDSIKSEIIEPVVKTAKQREKALEIISTTIKEDLENSRIIPDQNLSQSESPENL
ncbi:hypothetical protein ACFLZY_00985 [Patescibacteria group bacterium]